VETIFSLKESKKIIARLSIVYVIIIIVIMQQQQQQQK